MRSIPTTVEGVEAWLVDAPLTRVEVSREFPPPLTARGADAWARQRADNPRLFDGPILAALGYDASDDTLRVLARRDGFARLVVQPMVPTGVRLLALTAVLVARDAVGREHVLLGQRGTGTRIYDGLWELGPSGGIDPPPAGVEVMDLPMIMARLADEIAEEIGPELARRVAGAPARVVAITRDHLAFADDLCIRVDLGDLSAVADLAHPANWEYRQTLWLPIDTYVAWEDPAKVIPPTRALARALGWVGGA